MTEQRRKKITDYQPDPVNANKGTERGHRMIDDSVSEVGLGRSVLADKNGVLIAGNKTHQAAVDNGFEDVIEVETDGKTLVVVRRTDLDLNDPDPNNPARKAAYYDNRAGQLNLAWDAETLLRDMQSGVDLDKYFQTDELDTLLAELKQQDSESADAVSTEQARKTLVERFIVPPFSVLDARQGYWQERKRAWLALGLQSELGRGGNELGLSEQTEEYRQSKRNYSKTNAAPGGSLRPAASLSPDGKTQRGDGKGHAITSNGKSPARKFAQDLMRGEHVVGQNPETASLKGGLTWATSIHPYDATGEKRNSRYDADQRSNLNNAPALPIGATQTGTANMSSGTSIFDPVLCELAYRWFSPPAGHVLDPFAGGSVRGIVAALLGRKYTGLDLRAEQIAANEQQAAVITPDNAPRWITGDSRAIADHAPGAYDLIFTCPPYFDLEIYSDDEQDLSNAGDYAAFIADYRAIILQCVAMLNNNRFACIVIGDIRDKRGHYRNFVSDTIAAFIDAGMALYNEAILVTAAGSLPIRVGKQFSAGRKLGKTHQNVLVFVKGDAKQATVDCGDIDVFIPENDSAIDSEYGERLIVS